MILVTTSQGRQPNREVFSMEKLHRLLGKALESAWDPSTRRAYQSHLRSYLQFMHAHKLSPNPTEYKVAIYIAYTSQFIKLTSVKSYLTSITHYLTPIYPEIRSIRVSPFIKQTLRGCKKIHNTPVSHKRPLALTEIKNTGDNYKHKSHHDDLLFISQLLVGFFSLLRLGELVYPN